MTDAPFDLTTLQLARRIADAVLATKPWAPVDDHDDPATQAVLRVLRETGSWFCRLSEDTTGSTVQEQYALFPR